MLTLISKIKKQLLWLWLGFSIPALLLVFVQTIAGKYTEIEATPWIWAGINILPGFSILLFGAIRNKGAGKFVQTFIYRIILVAVIAYLLLVLMTLFSMTAGSAEQSLATYFQRSYQWLLPFQLLLMGVFGLLYFREEAMFKPNEKMIKDHVAKQMKKASAKNNVSQQTAFELLVANDYPKLFENLLQRFEKEEEKKGQLFLLQAQHSEWVKKTNLGLMNEKDAQLTINRITMALINMIERL